MREIILDELRNKTVTVKLSLGEPETPTSFHILTISVGIVEVFCLMFRNDEADLAKNRYDDFIRKMNVEYL